MRLKNDKKKILAPTEIRLELVDNALDFLAVGVEIFFSYEDRDTNTRTPHTADFRFGVPAPNDNPRTSHHVYETSHQRLFTDPVRRRKHAMLNLFSGVLLLLKERLRRIHPNLLYKEIGRAPTKNSKTIDFDETVSRIQAFVGKDVLSEGQRRLLTLAQGVRNSIEHHTFEESRFRLDNVIPRLVEFADEFASKELNIDILHKLDFETRDHVSSLKKVAERLEREEEQRCKDLLKRVDALTDDELAELGDVESYHPKHNPDPVELLYCGACGEQSVRIVEGGRAAICTRPECRESLLMSTCHRCEAPVPYDEWLCEGCAEYIERQ